MLKKIREDMLEAKKSGDKFAANLLSTLYGEAIRIGKDDGNRESTDAEVIKVITKFLKGLDDTIAAKKKIGREFSSEEKEVLILKEYLPQMMSDEELKKIIDGYIEELEERSMKQMGVVMKKLKEDHGGLFDGKTASLYVKEKLQ